MDIASKIDPKAKAVVRKLQGKGFQAYIVGGVLRDILIRKQTKDYDIATDARPKDVMGIFKKTVPTGLKHGTVTVVEGDRLYEVTTFRTEGGYSDARRPDSVRFITDIREDLSRRDFTVNAMAYDPVTKILIDPYGGLRDLRKRTIRTVGDATKRFREDALRVIRGARFASVLGFKLEDKTRRAIPSVLARVKRLSGERIRDELKKILLSKKPSVGLKILHSSRVLKIFLPELAECAGFDQGGFHEYDLLEHSLKACDNAPSGNWLLRLAALLHDIGKTRTRAIEKGDCHFYGHENVGAAAALKIMQRLKFSNREMEYVTLMIKNHMFNYNQEWKEGAVRRLLGRVGKERIDELLEFRLADIRACGRYRRPSKDLKILKDRIEKIRNSDMALKITDLAVDGNDVMKVLKIKPGKPVGETLKSLLEVVLDDSTKNTRKELLSRLNKIRQGRKMD